MVRALECISYITTRLYILLLELNHKSIRMAQRVKVDQVLKCLCPDQCFQTLIFSMELRRQETGN